MRGTQQEMQLFIDSPPFPTLLMPMLLPFVCVCVRLHMHVCVCLIFLSFFDSAFLVSLIWKGEMMHTKHFLSS